MPVRSYVAAVVLFVGLGLLLLPQAARAVEPIQFEQETLRNGLRVIYAPLENSPVAHVRVLYHVGSKDERPDRQGFAHMFEHMMFRGSAHVAPEEHMKTIGMVGGYSNAFTSFDQTVYINTVPAAYLETALYLEADRMASFKVSSQIFATERLVVAEEWRLRQNQPYGTMFEELLGRVFTEHPYRWTPIGNMDHLRAAAAPELQEFFNKYYVPNNAVLVVAGKIDGTRTREMVRRYYAWIPGNAGVIAEKQPAPGQGPVQYVPRPVARNIPAEPVPTQPRRAELTMRVPLARVIIAYPMPATTSPDMDALSVLSAILGDGRSSRLSRALVTSDKPLCTSANSMAMGLEDAGVLGAMATVLDGQSPGDVEQAVRATIADLRDHGATAAELAKAKQQARIALAGRRETAERVASELGEEALLRNDPGRVNTEEQRLEKITLADVQAVAKKYFVDQRATTLIIKPGQPASTGPAERIINAPTTASATTTRPAIVAAPRAIQFPADFPPTVPLPKTALSATFEKGVEKDIQGVKVIVMPDRRIPLVHWNLTLRMGSHAEPAGKEGLGSLATAMVRRGPKGLTFNAFNQDLEARAISIEVSDSGDTTRVSGRCLREEITYALEQARRMLRDPALAPEEFTKLKAQSLSALRMALNNPTAVAEQEVARLVFGNSPLGRRTTVASLTSTTLEDVKAYYEKIFRLNNAVLTISGDVSVEEGQTLAAKLLHGWPAGDLPTATYNVPPVPAQRQIVLIDRPDSKQANVRLGIRAYSIRSDDKFAGTLAGQMLSSGIHSRLGRYVRAEKGLAYGVWGVFSPDRHDGEFVGGTDTKTESAADAVEAMFKVFATMRKEDVAPQELEEAKLRISGSMVMQMQTVQQQANRRMEGILNDYPLDYYDRYAERIAKVTAAEVRQVMAKYVDDGRMAIVIVAPAEKVKAALERLGKVEVKGMPLVK